MTSIEQYIDKGDQYKCTSFRDISLLSVVGEMYYGWLLINNWNCVNF